MRSLWAFLRQLQFLDLLGFMKIMGWYTCHLFLQSLFSCNHCFFSARALIESPFLLRVQPHFIKNENDVLHLFFYVHCNVPDDLPNRRTFHDFEPQKSMAHIFNKSAMWGMWPVGTGDVNENPGLKLRKERWNLNWRSWASHHVFWQITHWASGKKQWIFPCCFTLPVVSLDRLQLLMSWQVVDLNDVLSQSFLRCQDVPSKQQMGWVDGLLWYFQKIWIVKFQWRPHLTL